MITRSKQERTALILSACLARKDFMAFPRCSSRLVSWHTTSHAGGERHFPFLPLLFHQREHADKKSRHRCRLGHRSDGLHPGGPRPPHSLISLVVALPL